MNTVWCGTRPYWLYPADHVENNKRRHKGDANQKRDNTTHVTPSYTV